MKKPTESRFYLFVIILHGSTMKKCVQQKKMMQKLNQAKTRMGLRTTGIPNSESNETSTLNPISEAFAMLTLLLKNIYYTQQKAQVMVLAAMLLDGAPDAVIQCRSPFSTII